MLDLAAIFQRLKFRTPNQLNEKSLMLEFEKNYPGFKEHCEIRYNIPQISGEISLGVLCDKHNLPAPLIVFAEFQLKSRTGQIKLITAEELLSRIHEFEILDVRETWERRYGSLPQSQILTRQLMKTLLKEWPRTRPLLVYCHFGVRSLDAASVLCDNGFHNVTVLSGGIDAWAQFDLTVQKYEHGWC